MCRGFVAINIDKDEESTKDVYSLMMNYMDRSFNKRNDDGFFFEIIDSEKDDRKSVRSLELLDALDLIEENKSELSGVVHGHARWTSVGGTSEQNVHGWQYKGYSCSMNGTFDMDEKFMIHDTDSQSFFALAFAEGVYDEDYKVWAQNLKQLLNQVVTSGKGALFFVNPDVTLVLCINKPVTYRLINDRVVALNTNDDIHYAALSDVSVKLQDSTDDKLQAGALTIKKESWSKSKVRKYPSARTIISDYKGVLDDEIALIDNETGSVEFRIELKKIPTTVQYSQGFHNAGTRNTPTTGSASGSSSFRNEYFAEVEESLTEMGNIGSVIQKLVTANFRYNERKNSDIEDGIGLAALFDGSLGVVP